MLRDELPWSRSGKPGHARQPLNVRRKAARLTASESAFNMRLSVRMIEIRDRRRSEIGGAWSIRDVLALMVLLPISVSCGLFTDVETSIDASTPSDAPAEIVLPTMRCGDYFIVDALIDGQGPFRLLLDTGYPRTQLSRTAASALGVGRSVRSLEAGGFRATGRIRVGVRDLDLISHALGAEIDGILGYTVFGELLLTYDFPRSEVRVGRDSIAPGVAGVLPLATGERPFLYARIGDEPVRLVLDTGFSGALALAGFDRLPVIDSARVVGSRVRVDGVQRRRGARLAQDIVLGSMVIRTPVAVDAASSRNLLGQSILRNYVVALDRARGRVRIQSPDGSAPDSIVVPPLYGTGMVLIPHEKHYEVADVIEGSAADQAGIVAGDRVIAIDGTPVFERGCQARESPESPQSRSYTIERDDRRIEIRLTAGVLVT